MKGQLLYGVYAVVSNKTVRQNEKLYIVWYNKDESIPGSKMVKTNRGYFIDGYNVDEKAVTTWFDMTKLDRTKKSNFKNKSWKNKK